LRVARRGLILIVEAPRRVVRPRDNSHRPARTPQV